MKTLTKILMNTGLTVLAVRTLFGGFTPLKYSYYSGEYWTCPVDQVFSTHRGYETSHSDENGVVHKINFSEDSNMPFTKIPKSIPAEVRKDFKYFGSDCRAIVIKDLSPGSRGYARVIDWTEEFLLFIPSRAYHAEIHIPRNQKLEPGYEAVHVGKSTTYHQMGEIK